MAKPLLDESAQYSDRLNFQLGPPARVRLRVVHPHLHGAALGQGLRRGGEAGQRVGPAQVPAQFILDAARDRVFSNNSDSVGFLIQAVDLSAGAVQGLTQAAGHVGQYLVYGEAG